MLTSSVRVRHYSGNRGLPGHRIIEVDGPTSSGKSPLAPSAIPQAQWEAADAPSIDAAHALDIACARQFGGKTAELLSRSPTEGSPPSRSATCSRSGAVDIVPIGSVAALVARAAFEGDMATPIWACRPDL